MEIAEKANEAAHKNDQRELYRLYREMEDRGEQSRRDGGKLTVPNPEQEREAWAEHFKKVSETVGEVPPHSGGPLDGHMAGRCPK